MTPLRKRLHGAIAEFLAKHGFDEVSCTVDEQFFGNTVIEFSSKAMDIRFVTDRDIMMVDVRPPNSAHEWYSLDFALELLGYPWSATSGLSDNELAAVLEKEHRAIAMLFHPASLRETELRMEELARTPLPKLH